MARRKIRRLRPPVMLATVFRRAREVLDERGHAKFVLENSRGACCLYGALNCAVNGSPLRWSHSFHTPATRVFTELLGLPVYQADGASLHNHHVVIWNNADKRRKRDVIALLKRAELKAAREKARLVP